MVRSQGFSRAWRSSKSTYNKILATSFSLLSQVIRSYLCKFLVIEDLERASRRDFTDSGGVEAVVIIAVTRLDEYGRIWQTLGVHFTANIVKMNTCLIKNAITRLDKYVLFAASAVQMIICLIQKTNRMLISCSLYQSIDPSRELTQWNLDKMFVSKCLSPNSITNQSFMS